LKIDNLALVPFQASAVTADAIIRVVRIRSREERL
jgi:hypothetical protein